MSQIIEVIDTNLKQGLMYLRAERKNNQVKATVGFRSVLLIMRIQGFERRVWRDLKNRRVYRIEPWLLSPRPFGKALWLNSQSTQ